jgi:hypothetical protein
MNFGSCLAGEQMDDGNKESIKEMLSTFRTLFAIGVSGLILLANLNANRALRYHSNNLFWFGMMLAAFSLAMMVYLFFLAVPKISEQEDAIIYQRDILIVSLISFWSFIVAYVLILIDVLWR